MKTELICRWGVVIAFTVVISLAQTTYAQRGTGADALMKGRPIQTTEDIDALQSGDVIAMACPKCKTIAFKHVEEGRGAAKPLAVGAKHTCPGCKSTITTKGVGKSATDEIVHVCQKCGSELAYCCSIKKDELTKGMEPK